MLLNDNHYDSEEQYEQDCLDMAARCYECETLINEASDLDVFVDGKDICSECAFDAFGLLRLAGLREVGRLRVRRALDALKVKSC